MRRVREFVFLAAWVVMSWILHSHIIQPLPLEGLPKLTLFAFEGFVDTYTLLELVSFFWPYEVPSRRWLRDKLRARQISRRRLRRQRRRSLKP